MSIIKKIESKVSKTMLKYNMIEKDDRILIAYSGGKDSIVMTDILINLKRKVPFNFELKLITVSALPKKQIINNITQFGIDYKIIEFDNSTLKGTKSPCQICSRIRRGSLYEYAYKNRYNKIALGHHLDDVIQTSFMNQLFQAKLETMKAKFISDDKRNIIIRPLHSILEDDIIKYFNEKEFKLLNRNCTFRVTKTKREEIKVLLDRFNKMEKSNIYYSLKDFY